MTGVAKSFVTCGEASLPHIYAGQPKWSRSRVGALRLVGEASLRLMINDTFSPKIHLPTVPLLVIKIRVFPLRGFADRHHHDFMQER